MADFRTPEVEYKDDDEDPENFVYIELDIPKLKKKLFSKNASNGEVNMEYHGERSFTFIATVKDDGKEEKFKYSITTLPDAIDKSKTTCKVVKDGVVVLKLCKSSPRLWRELATTGLEQGQGDN